MPTTATRLEQTVDIGTDVASFFIFHPDDLAHREHDPLDWHDYSFACRKEFEAGNLIAFRTGADGGYQLRLTGGDLTDAEHKRETGSWEWGYTVRHGKVLVDNGDYLPSEEASDIKSAPKDQWVTIPNGDYRVTVHPIARQGDSLPDYVIRFEPVDKPLHLAKSPSPPDLIPLQDRPPKAVEGGSADHIYTPSDDKPLAATYPLLVAPGQYVLPGSSASVTVEDDLFNAVSNEDPALTGGSDGWDIHIVLASGEEVPTLATVVWVNGHLQLTGEKGRLSLRGEHVVRVTAQKEGKPLPTATVEAVTREKSDLDTATIHALKEAFAKYAGAHTKGKNKIASFEQERVTAMTSGSALTTRLIELVPMPMETRFWLQGASDTERAKELKALLEDK